MLKPMSVIKVDARSNKNATFNDVMSKPLNKPEWIDTTVANRDFDKIQQEMMNRNDYVLKILPDLNVTPARLVYFGLSK